MKGDVIGTVWDEANESRRFRLFFFGNVGTMIGWISRQMGKERIVSLSEVWKRMGLGKKKRNIEKGWEREGESAKGSQNYTCD